MKKITHLFILFFVSFSWSQVDYSNKWEDFYSYNNVKDFVKANDILYAVSDNAIFTYNLNTSSVEKISSVNGLSGEETSTIYYSEALDKIIIGYQNGLLEIIDSKGNITTAKDIVNFSYTGSKSINNIFEYNNKLYLSTAFAIIVYDLDKLQFGDTYFIGDLSSELVINEITVFENTIYAATENGVYTANVLDSNLIDYNNWTQNYTGNFTRVEVFNNQVFLAKEKSLYTFNNNTLTLQKTYSETIKNLKISSNFLAITTKSNVYVNNTDALEIVSYTPASTNDYYTTLNAAFYEDSVLFLATSDFGILKSGFSSTSNFEEIHPEGPISNSPFSIGVKDNNLWVVYGGYDTSYGPINGKYGVSHYNGENWLNIPYSSFNVKNLVNITFNNLDADKVYLSSWGASSPTDVSNTGGMLVIENDEVVDFWNYSNSGLENLVYAANPNYISTRINGSAFDSQGNLWIANAWVDNRIKKYSTNGTWSSVDMSSVLTNPALGLNELIVDSSNTVWIGSRKNGVLVYNETGNNKTSLTTELTKGSLPDLNVRTIKSDASNRVWIGTLKGLVVLYNSSTVFSSSNIEATSVIISDEDGIAQKLLGEQVINSIDIDGADNKWFGTQSGGVLHTNPSGSETLNSFNKDNSPLPSNNILKIAVDDDSGKVFFATENGIVAYNSNVSLYGDTLPEVYAYPNPSTKNNQYITIDGRKGTHLPNNTNVKILDTAGNLVYETNVTEGEELYGGKVIWDKTNLAGRKVASGIYIVLLTANESTETTITKIAIIN